MIDIRRQLTPTAVATWSAAISHHLLSRFATPPGRRIAFCWPIHNEPDVRAALLAWQAAGATLALPVVMAPGTPLAFRIWTATTPLEPDRYGIPSPTEGDWIVPDTIFLPLNAFDPAGYRLGYGGGFFDRTLAALAPRPLSIGIGFEINRVESIGPEIHDQPLDLIATEAGISQPS